MKNKLSSHVPLGFERLEDRRVLAGNVTVAITGSGSNRDLVITGDNSSNDIVIYQPTTIDEFHVLGRNNTRVNGVLNGRYRFNIYDYNDDMKIDLNGGNDNVYMRGADSGFGDLDVWNDLYVYGDSGRDRIELRYVETGGSGASDSDIYILTGSGPDFVKMRYIDVQDDLIVRNSTSSQSGGIKVRADVYDTYVGDNLDIDFHYSVGIVNMRHVNARDMFVSLIGQNDYLNLKYSRARSTHDFNGGSGTDSLNLYQNDTNFVGTSFKTPTRSNLWYS